MLAVPFALAAMPVLPVRAVHADDDRPPTPRERRRIEAALRRHGFVRWGRIELDDGRWEIDDAVRADGREYDVELSRRDLSILRLERDD